MISGRFLKNLTGCNHRCFDRNIILLFQHLHFGHRTQQELINMAAADKTTNVYRKNPNKMCFWGALTFDSATSPETLTSPNQVENLVVQKRFTQTPSKVAKKHQKTQVFSIFESNLTSARHQKTEPPNKAPPPAPG